MENWYNDIELCSIYDDEVFDMDMIEAVKFCHFKNYNKQNNIKIENNIIVNTSLSIANIYTSTNWHFPSTITTKRKVIITNNKNSILSKTESILPTMYSLHREGCFTGDLPLRKRGFNTILKGYEKYSNLKPLIEILIKLYNTERGLIFIGDSVTRQEYNAFLFELEREEHTNSNLLCTTDSQIINVNLENESKNYNYNYIYNLKKKFNENYPNHVDYLYNMCVWSPNITSPLYIKNKPPVVIYNIFNEVKQFDIENINKDIMLNKFIPDLNKIIHPNGIIMIVNMGLHFGIYIFMFYLYM